MQASLEFQSSKKVGRSKSQVQILAQRYKNQIVLWLHNHFSDLLKHLLMRIFLPAELGVKLVFAETAKQHIKLDDF